MANSTLKTRKNDASVIEFLESVDNDQRREDAFRALELFGEVTGEPAKMWGSSIVGFGEYHYVYESGREGDWMKTGFSPRKNALTLYIMSGFSDYDELMAKLGKYKTGKSCLYVKKLDDVDAEVLKELISESCDYIDRKYDS